MKEVQIFEGIEFVLQYNGYYKSNKRVKYGLNQWMHRYVWEAFNGPIPDGYHVHHLDGNRANNDITNLALCVGTEHLCKHTRKWCCSHKEQVAANLSSMRKAASEWHKSKEGREWHIKHWQSSLGAAATILESKVCENCGASYSTSKIAATHSRFCSNKCKAAWRRKSHVDDVERVCVVCGKHFTRNKYSKTQTCSRACSGKLQSRTKGGTPNEG